MQRQHLPKGRSDLGSEKDRRRHLRERVIWPVVVDDGNRFFQAETVNISSLGVKLRLDERFPIGAQVKLNVRPPDRRPYNVRGVVWRIDPDGPALLLLGAHQQQHPVSAGSSTAAPSDAVNRDALRGTETVLLVDGDASARALARRALEARGYTVLDAGADPVRAVRFAKEHDGPIHLLVTDIVMPMMNGIHLVERVLPLRPDLKVVFMSAYPVSGVSARSDRFVRKPFSGEDLARTVRETLDGRSVFGRPRKPAP